MDDDLQMDSDLDERRPQVNDLQMLEPSGGHPVSYRVIQSRADFLASNPFFGTDYKLKNSLLFTVPKHFTLDGNKFELLGDTLKMPADRAKFVDHFQPDVDLERIFDRKRSGKRSHSRRRSRSRRRSHSGRRSRSFGDSFEWETSRPQFKADPFDESFSNRWSPQHQASGAFGPRSGMPQFEPQSNMPPFAPGSSATQFEPQSNTPPFEPRSNTPQFIPRSSTLPLAPRTSTPRFVPQPTGSPFLLDPFAAGLISGPVLGPISGLAPEVAVGPTSGLVPAAGLASGPASGLAPGLTSGPPSGPASGPASRLPPRTAPKKRTYFSSSDASDSESTSHSSPSDEPFAGFPRRNSFGKRSRHSLDESPESGRWSHVEDPRRSRWSEFNKDRFAKRNWSSRQQFSDDPYPTPDTTTFSDENWQGKRQARRWLDEPWRYDRQEFNENRFSKNRNGWQKRSHHSPTDPYRSNRFHSADDQFKPPAYECKPKIDFSSQFGQPDSSHLCPAGQSAAQPTTKPNGFASPPLQKKYEEPTGSSATAAQSYGGDDLLQNFFSGEPKSKPFKPKPENRYTSNVRHTSNVQCKAKGCDCNPDKLHANKPIEQPAPDFDIQLPDILDLQITLEQLQAWLDLKNLKDTAIGCFVRIPIDPSYTQFTIAQVTGLTEANSYRIGRQQTTMHLILFIPESVNDRTLVRMNFISNRCFTQEEFGRWRQAGRRSNDFPLNLRHFEVKKMQLKQIQLDHKAEMEKRKRQEAVLPPRHSLSDPEEGELVEWDALD